MSMEPPSGIASRELIARLRIASSSWLASTRAGGRLAGISSRRAWRGTLGSQLRQQILALDFGGLARGDVGRHPDQRLDAAIGPAHRAGAGVDPMHRTVGPDIAVFETVILAGRDRAVEHVLPRRAVV